MQGVCPCLAWLSCVQTYSCPQVVHANATAHQSLYAADEEDETAQSSSSQSRFPISKDDAVTIAIALAVSTLVRTYQSTSDPLQCSLLMQ